MAKYHASSCFDNYLASDYMEKALDINIRTNIKSKLLVTNEVENK